MRKYEIASLLASRFGYTKYLEICTPTTGGTFSAVDKQQFSRRVRVMYKRPADFVEDPEPIDFSTEDESSEELLANIISSGERFDLVFIDSYHTYEASLRDIVYGLQLIGNGGLLLIHDCFPPNKACTASDFTPGEWCGVTFAAYLDTVLYTEDIHYVTVDSDYGCGIIGKDSRVDQLSNLHPTADLIQEWRRLDLSRKYPFFEKYHSQLLRLVSPAEFHERLFQPSAQNTPLTSSLRQNSQELGQGDIRQDDLEIIKNTLTWKLHEHITSVTVLQKFYLAIVKPLILAFRRDVKDQQNK